VHIFRKSIAFHLCVFSPQLIDIELCSGRYSVLKFAYCERLAQLPNNYVRTLVSEWISPCVRWA